MFKIASLFALASLVMATTIGSYDCTTEECSYKNPPSTLSLVSEPQIIRTIENELRRQFWYYLKDSEVIEQLKFSTNERLIIYYFHRNNLGTFLTICSWFYKSMHSEVNTMVRLGSGYKIGVSEGSDFIDDVDPRILIAGSEQWALEITYDELGNLVLAD